MSLAHQIKEYERELDENEKQIRKMVLDSYSDSEDGKCRDCNKFFDELEKNLKSPETSLNMDYGFREK